MNNFFNKRLALGSVQFGLDYGINNPGGKVPFDEVLSILSFAHDKGIDMIDTAQGYGNSESVVGNAQNQLKKSFHLVSKAKPGSRKDDIRRDFENSLKLLKCEKLYAFLLHRFNDYDPELWDELIALRDEGLVDKIGFSLYYPNDLKFFLESNIDFDIVQIPYNICDQRFEEFFPIMSDNDIEIHIRSVFLQGLFFIDPEQHTEHFAPIRSKMEKLHTFSLENNVPIYAICILFVLLNRFVDRVVLGIDRVENLKENLSIIDHKEIIVKNYDFFKSFVENDENIILPFNWSKGK